MHSLWIVIQIIVQFIYDHRLTFGFLGALFVAVLPKVDQNGKVEPWTFYGIFWKYANGIAANTPHKPVDIPEYAAVSHTVQGGITETTKYENKSPVVEKAL